MALNLLKKIIFRNSLSGTKKRKSVFVSYDEADNFFACELTKYLAKQELPPLVNRYANGTCVIEDFQKQINGCEVFLLIMSTNSRKSVHVAQEIEVAMKGNKFIIPLSLENEIFSEFENVQAGNASEPYSLLIELSERLRQLLIPSQMPGKQMQRARIEYVVVLLAERLYLTEEPILYDGKSFIPDHSTILNKQITDLDELDWLEVYISFEQIFISEKYCKQNYNSVLFPTIKHLVDYLYKKLSWEEIKNIQLTGM